MEKEWRAVLAEDEEETKEERAERRAIEAYKEKQRKLITISQFEKNKKALESSIIDLIKEFEEKNPAWVEAIQLEKEYCYYEFKYANKF